VVECQLPKLDVVGSSPISRSIFQQLSVLAASAWRRKWNNRNTEHWQSVEVKRQNRSDVQEVRLDVMVPAGDPSTAVQAAERLLLRRVQAISTICGQRRVAGRIQFLEVRAVLDGDPAVPH
jgi:hypothetical protein